MTVKAIAFDAYGTLFDVYSVGALAEELFPGYGSQISTLWRDKQIDYTRLRTLCDKYVTFWQVTTDALRYSCKALGLDLTEAKEKALLDQYAKLVAFPENLAVLEELKDKGYQLAILTNADPAMLQGAVESAGMTNVFDHLLSVDTVKKFKTADESYALAPKTFCLPREAIGFVSSNAWDVAGATWFGFKTFWVNRQNMPMEELGVEPVGMGSDLRDLVPFVESL